MRVLNTAATLTVTASLVFGQNLSESYAPIYVDCPTDVTFVRPASDGINPDEDIWMQGRKRVIAGALGQYLTNAGLNNFDVNSYISRLNASNYENVPLIGLGVSGGGYASAIMGAGIVRALDSREEVSVKAGTGGLLQAMSFLSGQSGGSWFVSTEIANSLPIAEDLLAYWQPSLDRYGVKTNGTHAATLASIGVDILNKYKAGFNVSVADFIGRINAYEFVMGTHGGINATMSNIKDLSKFKSYEMPLPIIQVSQVTEGDPVEDGLLVPTMKSPMYEFTPYEFGTWMDPVQSFADIEYLGTTMMNGQPANKSACVKGFDRVSFVMGASANAYEFWYLENQSNGTLGQFPKREALLEQAPHHSTQSPADLSKRLLAIFPDQEVEELAAPFAKGLNLSLEDYTYTPIPNPWRNTSTAKDTLLHMVDATEPASSLPLAGQLARNATFIIAWDDNSDAYPYGWVNGTSMYQAYQYFKQKAIPFPIVPPVSTFIARNYTSRPVFFGCTANQTTTGSTEGVPIIAWFANAPYSSYSNITYFDSDLSDNRVRDLWNNTFNEITQGANSLDPEWSACLACAAIDRTLEKVGVARSKQCDMCLARWCWDGTTADDDGHADETVVLDPTLLLDPGLGFLQWNATTNGGNNATD